MGFKGFLDGKSKEKFSGTWKSASILNASYSIVFLFRFLLRCYAVLCFDFCFHCAVC